MPVPDANPAVPTQHVSAPQVTPKINAPAPETIQTDSSKPVTPDVSLPGKSDGKSVPKTVSRGSLSISLKGNVHATNDNQSIRQETVINVITPFSQIDLNAAWKKYAESLKEKLHLKNTMLNILPQLQDNYKISVSVYNPEQKEKLEEEATSLMEFLRKELKNSSVQMDVVVTEENTKKLAYTNQEKYKLMASENPNLNKLAEEFSLRLS